MTLDELLAVAQRVRDFMANLYEEKHLQLKEALLITAVSSACLVEDMADQVETTTIGETKGIFYKLFNAYFNGKEQQSNIVIERNGIKHRLCRDKSKSLPDTCMGCSLVEECSPSSGRTLCCEIADEFKMEGFYHFELDTENE